MPREHVPATTRGGPFVRRWLRGLPCKPREPCRQLEREQLHCRCNCMRGRRGSEPCRRLRLHWRVLPRQWWCLCCVPSRNGLARGGGKLSWCVFALRAWELQRQRSKCLLALPAWICDEWKRLDVVLAMCRRRALPRGRRSRGEAFGGGRSRLSHGRAQFAQLATLFKKRGCLGRDRRMVARAHSRLSRVGGRSYCPTPCVAERALHGV